MVKMKLIDLASRAIGSISGVVAFIALNLHHVLPNTLLYIVMILLLIAIASDEVLSIATLFLALLPLFGYPIALIIPGLLILFVRSITVYIFIKLSIPAKLFIAREILFIVLVLILSYVVATYIKYTVIQLELIPIFTHYLLIATLIALWCFIALFIVEGAVQLKTMLRIVKVMSTVILLITALVATIALLDLKILAIFLFTKIIEYFIKSRIVGFRAEILSILSPLSLLVYVFLFHPYI